MKTFVCNQCGEEVRRPTAPLKCPQCNQQRIGLFKVKPSTPSPPADAPPATTAGGAAPPAPAAPATPTPSSTPSPPAQTAPIPAAPIPAAPPPPAPIPAAPAPPNTSAASSATPPPPAAAPAAPTPAPPRPSESVPLPDQPPTADVSVPPADDDDSQPPSPAAEFTPSPAPARPTTPKPDRPAERPTLPSDARPASEPQEAKDDAPGKNEPVKAAAVKTTSDKDASDSGSAADPATPLPPAADSETPQRVDPAKSKAAAKRQPGTIAWTFPKQIPGQDYSKSPIRSCPVPVEKTKFFACLGKKLIALDWKNSGLEKMWEYETGGHIPGSPVLGKDGLIRIHSGDGHVYCINKSGNEVWSPVDVGEPLGWAAPIVDHRGNTYVSCYSGGLIKIYSSGEEERSPFFRTRQKFDCTGLINQGVLYVGSEDAFIYAIELGESRGKSIWDHLEDRGKTEWFVNSAPAMTPNSTLVVAGRDENLYGFHTDGKLAWKIFIPGQMLGHPVVSGNGDIFIGVSIVRFHQQDQGKLICIDGDTHRVRWEYEAKGAVESTPVIGDDDVIYFGDNAGVIHAVRGDGHCLWTREVRSPVRSCGCIVGANRLVFGLDNGMLVGLLCSSGGLATSGWPKYMAKNR